MLRKLSEKKERQNAQGMVEFALILPILLLVILGIIEFGRLLFFYSSVTSASREAARYGSAALITKPVTTTSVSFAKL